MILPSLLSHSTRLMLSMLSLSSPGGDPRQPPQPGAPCLRPSPRIHMCRDDKRALHSRLAEGSLAPLPWLRMKRPSPSSRLFATRSGNARRRRRGWTCLPLPWMPGIPGHKAQELLRHPVHGPQAQGSTPPGLLFAFATGAEGRVSRRGRTLRHEPWSRKPPGGGCPVPKGWPPDQHRGAGIRVRPPSATAAQAGDEAAGGPWTGRPESPNLWVKSAQVQEKTPPRFPCGLGRAVQPGEFRRLLHSPRRQFEDQGGEIGHEHLRGVKGIIPWKVWRYRGGSRRRGRGGRPGLSAALPRPWKSRP